MEPRTTQPDDAVETSFFDDFAQAPETSELEPAGFDDVPLSQQRWFKIVVIFVACAVGLALVMGIVAHFGRQREKAWDGAAETMAATLGVASGTASYAEEVLSAAEESEADQRLVGELTEAKGAVDQKVIDILAENGDVFSTPKGKNVAADVEPMDVATTDFWAEVPASGTFELAGGEVYQVNPAYKITAPDSDVKQDKGIIKRLETDAAELEVLVTNLASAAAQVDANIDSTELDAAKEAYKKASDELLAAAEAAGVVYAESVGKVADESIRGELQEKIDAARALLAAATPTDAAGYTAAAEGLEDALSPLQSATATVEKAVQDKQAADIAAREQAEADARATQEAEEEARRQEQENMTWEESDW